MLTIYHLITVLTRNKWAKWLKNAKLNPVIPWPITTKQYITKQYISTNHGLVLANLISSAASIQRSCSILSAEGTKASDPKSASSFTERTLSGRLSPSSSGLGWLPPWLLADLPASLMALDVIGLTSALSKTLLRSTRWCLVSMSNASVQRLQNSAIHMRQQESNVTSCC